MDTFWNRIKKARSPGCNNNLTDISLNVLEQHFTEKFLYDVTNENEFVSQCHESVEEKLKNCMICYEAFVFSEQMMKKYISALKPGCSPGTDGITSEHIKYANCNPLILHLCNVFTVCFKYGIVPSSFTNGLLVPILKKATLDPSVARNYRLVILSNILSKIIELYIVEVASNFRFNDFQFGFIEGRGTSTAISLAHDVAAYCHSKGSSVFMCELDAEGAFDGIPHPVLFNKAMK